MVDPDDPSGEDTNWKLLLRQSREAASLSRLEAARRCGLSPETLRAYETGRRRPSRDTLDAVLEMLAVDPARRNRILRGAGYSDDATWVGKQSDAPMYTLHEARRHIDSVPWPSHVNSEAFEVLAANSSMQRVWGADIESEFPDPVDRNMVAVLSTRRFGDCLVNWEEAVGIFASMVKGGYGEEALFDDQTNPYLAAVTERLLAGEPQYVQRFLRVWADATGTIYKWRFTYPIIWKRDDLPLMRFQVVVGPANLDDYMTFNDWIPADASTWEALHSLGDEAS